MQCWSQFTFMQTGSTEWVEENREMLSSRGVAYLNIDVSVVGPVLLPSTTPQLDELLLETIKLVRTLFQSKVTYLHYKRALTVLAIQKSNCPVVNTLQWVPQLWTTCLWQYHAYAIFLIKMLKKSKCSVFKINEGSRSWQFISDGVWFMGQSQCVSQGEL